jgi:Succinylglutamate desuccinylase / Aspartoacylase family
VSAGNVLAPPGESLFRRELGSRDQGRPGPTLVVLAGIHGNEPAGVHAVYSVLAALERGGVLLDGRLVALGGNLAALQKGRRFLRRDLNRQWLPDQVDALLQREPLLDQDEDREQRELIACFERVQASTRGPIVYLDLHTSSADGPPFLALADTIDNRRTGLGIGVPIILGLEETIDGASMEWWTARGVVNLACEGGRHGAPDTQRNLEAVLWLVLEQAGMLPRGRVDLAPHRQHLRRVTAGLPAIVEIVHRQVIAPTDHFAMQPGFTNFQVVRNGDLLAQDRNGEVRAPYDARVLLPLYQALGDDGFFLGRAVRPFWLKVARLLRWLKLDRIVHWLPGVRRDPEDRNSILVNPKVARWLVTELFHLLGFRRMSRRGDRLRFSRRWSLVHNRLLRPR